MSKNGNGNGQQLPNKRKPDVIKMPHSEPVNNAGAAGFQITHAEYSRSGPLPDPMELKQYDLVVPGAAERIFCIMEEQARHRMNLEKTVIEGDNKRATLGVWLAAFITVLFICLGGVIVLTGATLVGAGVGLTGVAGIIGTFIYGTRSRRQEREHKAEVAQQRKSK